MKEVELESGWFARQMKQSIDEAANWPKCLQALLHINSELKRANVYPEPNLRKMAD